MVYPNGSRETHDLMKGEIGFGYKGGMSHLSSSHSSYAPTISVTSCFNGLDEKGIGNMVFMGVIDKGFASSQPGGDSSVTMRRAGTHTIVNTGVNILTAGSLVYWTRPDVNTRGEPTVQVRGIDKGKYYAGLKSIRASDSITVFATLAHHALEDAKFMRDNGNVPHAEHRPLMQDKEDELIALGVAGVQAYGAAVRILAGVVQPVDFDTLLDALTDSEEKAIRDETFDNTQAYGGKASILEACGKVRERTVISYNDQIKTRTLGRALCTSAPGQQLDLILGTS